MTSNLRELSIKDHDQLIEVSKSVWDDDYAPNNFPEWIDDENWYVFGRFASEKLLGFAALQLIPHTNIGWVKALRIRDNQHGKGIGTELTIHIVEKSKKLGVKKLWYATSSRNNASQRIAEKSGFHLANEVGYFRLERPLPPRPNPSPNLEPEVVDVNRVQEILDVYPDLIPTDTIPIAWNFETKDTDGLARIADIATFNIIRDHNGTPQALYYSYLRERDSNKAAITTFYVSERGIFVDCVARVIAEHENSDVDTLVFFLGPRATEWSKTLGIVPEEFHNRRFILYEQVF